MAQIREWQEFELAHKIERQERELAQISDLQRAARAQYCRDKAASRTRTGVLEITAKARDCRSKRATEAAKACPEGEAAAAGVKRGLAVKRICSSQTKLKRSVNEVMWSDAPGSKPF